MIIHIIPVGGNEPVHFAEAECWCYPVRDAAKADLWIHNAQDCREAKERQGAVKSGCFWVSIARKDLS